MEGATIRKFNREINGRQPKTDCYQRNTCVHGWRESKWDYSVWKREGRRKEWSEREGVKEGERERERKGEREGGRGWNLE